MSDELKIILSRELEELKQNKIRAGALGVCFLVLLIFWATDGDSGDEEITLTDESPLTKDLPVKELPASKVTESPDGVTVVLGANADKIFIDDPFAGNEEPPPPKSEPPPTPPLPKIPAASVPPIVIQPPQPPPTETPKLTEKIILTGTAISGNVKTAMFLRGKETLFLTVGEEVGGRRISEITPDFVTFEDGTRLKFQKELE